MDSSTTCQEGARFANASDADIRGLREAFDRAYTDLRRNPDGPVHRRDRAAQAADLHPRCRDPRWLHGPSPGLSGRAVG